MIDSDSDENNSSQVVAEDETGEKIVYEPPEFVFMNSDKKLQKEYDDDLISKETVHQRLSSLPDEISNRTQIPKRKFMINYIDGDSSSDKLKVKSSYVDPADVRIKKNNTVQLLSKDEGWISFEYELKESFTKLRDIIVEMHRDINYEIHDFNKNHPNKPIKIDLYTHRSFDENTKLFQYKNTPFIVPNEILDDVVDLVSKKDISPNQLRRKIASKAKHYKVKTRKNQSTLYNDPLNRSSMIRSDTTKLAARNTPISSNETHMLSTPKLDARSRIKPSKRLFQASSGSSSTPIVKRQRAMTDTYRLVKNSSQSQKGKGIKWERI